MTGSSPPVPLEQHCIRYTRETTFIGTQVEHHVGFMSFLCIIFYGISHTAYLISNTINPVNYSQETVLRIFFLLTYTTVTLYDVMRGKG